MRVLKDTICRYCNSLFCCAECRYKHEIKNHAIPVQKNIKVNEQKESGTDKNTECDEIYIFCPICENKPLIVEQELHKEILPHIESFHLPLRCQKCFKTYTEINDFKEFSKCLSKRHESLSLNKSCLTDEASKVTVTKAAVPIRVISLASPSNRQNLHESNITPMSVINMRWKARSKLHQDVFICDSVSSIKNLSSISNSSSSQSTGIASVDKGELIRCSSTPVHLEMVVAKPKEQTFNATGGHMSSIRYYSGCDSDTSPVFSQPSGQALEPVNRYMKVTGSRLRMTPVTPLRHVMSKSIQKAIAEHGLPPSSTRKISYTYQRKKIFDSNSSAEINEQRSPIYPVLDLRLSPAVRRSEIAESASIKNFNKTESNDLPYLRREQLLSAQKLTTESIVITHTKQLSSVSSSTSAASSNFSINSVKPYLKSSNSNYESARCDSTESSVFNTCSSVEIITATTENIHSFDEEVVKNPVIEPNTPMLRMYAPSINKKYIKFETPKIPLSDLRQSTSSPNDEFFTPNSTPLHYNKETEWVETRQRKLSLKHNLNGTFSTFKTASIKESGHSAAISQIENFSNGLDDLYEGYNVDDEVFPPLNTPSEEKNYENNENHSKKPGGLWSIMASVMRFPSLTGKPKTTRETLKSETYSSTSSRSNSLIKRCASIAGSLVRSKSLVDENELCSLKRKRTYTTDNQTASSYLAELNSMEGTSLPSSLNTSSKRFRIQGRRPIDRMRLNS